jgi:hypothetical protein
MTKSLLFTRKREIYTLVQAKTTTTTRTTTSKVGYRIEAKPGGGFVGLPNDPTLETFEGATREEVQQKVVARLTELLQASIPTAVKTTTSKMSYRIEAKPGGGFIGLPSGPALGTVEGATREEVQQKVEARLMEAAQEQLLDFKLGSADVKVNRKVNFVSGKQAEQILEKLQLQGDTPVPGPQPIAPEESGNKILRFALAIIVVLALVYYLSHR